MYMPNAPDAEAAQPSPAADPFAMLYHPHADYYSPVPDDAPPKGKGRALDQHSLDDSIDKLIAAQVSEVRAFAERHGLDIDDIRQRVAAGHSRNTAPSLPSTAAPLELLRASQGETSSAAAPQSNPVSVSQTLNMLSAALESLHHTSGHDSFLLVVSPTDSDADGTSDGWLAGTQVGRDFWRALRGGGVGGAKALRARCRAKWLEAGGADASSSEGGVEVLEQSAALKSKPKKSSAQQKSLDIKVELNATMRLALREAADDPTAEMRWTKPEQLESYGVRLVGWPEGIQMRNPSNNPVRDNKTLLDLVKSKVIRFVKKGEPGWDTDYAKSPQYIATNQSLVPERSASVGSSSTASLMSRSTPSHSHSHSHSHSRIVPSPYQSSQMPPTLAPPPQHHHQQSPPQAPPPNHPHTSTSDFAAVVAAATAAAATVVQHQQQQQQQQQNTLQHLAHTSHLSALPSDTWNAALDAAARSYTQQHQHQQQQQQAQQPQHSQQPQPQHTHPHAHSHQQQSMSVHQSMQNMPLLADSATVEQFAVSLGRLVGVGMGKAAGQSQSPAQAQTQTHGHAQSQAGMHVPQGAFPGPEEREHMSDDHRNAMNDPGSGAGSEGASGEMEMEMNRDGCEGSEGDEGESEGGSSLSGAGAGVGVGIGVGGSVNGDLGTRADPDAAKRSGKRLGDEDADSERGRPNKKGKA
ncbi:hypothetical protein BOTBODRAFT_184332 [Botryobasidium botryosum FD-172 SS1]|uniref:Uncharacterized protein n=1 Tax=Botryobasidium botryosum (strain FD-172 SS1) TaxID=930990 RepID=A0A067MUH1_BOTB1|nr:hypothetical protein BOTBODRAFT_184332 [Botryobasidium botryosum FD-172 SS1]